MQFLEDIEQDFSMMRIDYAVAAVEELVPIIARLG